MDTHLWFGYYECLLGTVAEDLLKEVESYSVDTGEIVKEVKDRVFFYDYLEFDKSGYRYTFPHCSAVDRKWALEFGLRRFVWLAHHPISVLPDHWQRNQPHSSYNLGPQDLQFLSKWIIGELERATSKIAN